MTKSNWNFDRRDKQSLYEELFDITTGHRHDGTDSRVVAYQTVAAGQVGTALTSVSIALASIVATDAVVANVMTYITASYVAKIAITAGTGFLVTLNAAPGTATISYAVFRAS